VPLIRAPSKSAAHRALPFRTKECSMNDSPQTFERYLALDLHKHYVVVGGVNAEKQLIACLVEQQDMN
jgi:hypothetical protein